VCPSKKFRKRMTNRKNEKKGGKGKEAKEIKKNVLYFLVESLMRERRRE
jgi:hypothetical protein